MNRVQLFDSTNLKKDHQRDRRPLRRSRQKQRRRAEKEPDWSNEELIVIGNLQSITSEIQVVTDQAQRHGFGRECVAREEKNHIISTDKGCVSNLIPPDPAPAPAPTSTTPPGLRAPTTKSSSHSPRFSAGPDSSSATHRLLQLSHSDVITTQTSKPLTPSRMR